MAITFIVYVALSFAERNKMWQARKVTKNVAVPSADMYAAVHGQTYKRMSEACNAAYSNNHKYV